MNWGDLNGDGKSDYVDQKIFDTQINPYSGEYQGPTPSSGSDGSILIWGLIVLVALVVLSYIAQNIDLYGQFVCAVALIIAFRWRGFNNTHYPINRSYAKVLALLTVVVFALIACQRYVFNTSDHSYYSVVSLIAELIAYEMAKIVATVLLVRAFLKSTPVLTIIGMALFSGRLLGIVATPIFENHLLNWYTPIGLISMALPLVDYFMLTAAFKKPQNRTLSIIVIILSLLSLGISLLVFKSFLAFYPEVVLFCGTAITILLSNKTTSEKLRKTSNTTTNPTEDLSEQVEGAEHAKRILENTDEDDLWSEAEEARLSKFSIIGEEVVFGNYPQEEDADTGVTWVVLDTNENLSLLISKYALDAYQYNNDCINTSWEKCDLRKWLNHEFVDTAFSTIEQSAICTSTLQDVNTEDRIFLLSESETKQYYIYNHRRLCQITPYAESRGAFCNAIGRGWWWIRTIGEKENEAKCIDAEGKFRSIDVDNSDCSVRPALWVDTDLL